MLTPFRSPERTTAASRQSRMLSHPFHLLFDVDKMRVYLPFKTDQDFDSQFVKEYAPFEPVGTHGKHPHRHLMLDRLVAEQDAITTLNRISAGWIKDVGGSSTRHRRYNRTNIWSCQPLLEAQDALRPMYAQSACRHLGQQCNCKVFTSAMFVHSLYYLTPHDVLEILLNTTAKVGIAVIHLFGERQGSIGYGEATYTRQDGVVTMTVLGNSHVYKHSDMSWLSATKYETSGLTLAWEFIKPFSHSCQIGFIITTPLPSQPTTTYSVDECERITVPATATLGIWPFTWTKQYQITELVPKNLLADLCATIAGRPRNASTYQQLMAVGTRWLHDNQYRSPSSGRVLVVAVRHAFGKDQLVERDLLYDISDHGKLNETHSNALSLSRPSTTLQRISYGVSALGVAAAVGTSTHAPKTAGLLAGFGVLGAVGTLMSTSRRSQYEQPTRHTDDYTLVELEKTTKPKIHPLLNSEVELNEIDRTAFVSYDPIRYKDPTGILEPVGICFTGREPVAYAGNLHNEVLSVTNRLVAPKPQVDHGVVIQFRHFVENHFNTLFPGLQPIQENFEEWNSRYPTAQQARHVAALRSGGTVKNDPRKAFVKVEKLLPEVRGSVEHKTPRGIQGGTDATNVTIGPWIYAFSKELSRVWNKDHFLYYTSGESAESLGSWLRYTTHYIENDFTRFDSTLNKHLLDVEMLVYKKAGCPPSILKVLRLNTTKTRGSTPHGVRYSVDATRRSGDQNTSIGNSMINGLIHAFALNRCGIGPHRFNMAVLGDDNLICINTEIDVDAFSRWFRLVGLRPNIKITRNPNLVEFCSSRFWPTPEGRVLGPKIGRFLAKIGWVLRPPVGTTRKYKEYRGTLMSHVDSVAHVPICYEVVCKTLITMVEKRYIVDTEKRRRVERPHTTCDETWVMIENLYHLSRDDINELLDRVASIEDLPQSINSWIFQEIDKVDNA